MPSRHVNASMLGDRRQLRAVRLLPFAAAARRNWASARLDLRDGLSMPAETIDEEVHNALSLMLALIAWGTR